MQFTSKRGDFYATTEAALGPVAEALVGLGPRVFLLSGELGAGKTALVRALCAALNSPDEVSSPTFSLINEYSSGEGEPVFHIDLYRLETADDVLRIGIEDYIASGSWCFIEWPEVILDLIQPGNVLMVRIEVRNDGTRRITTLM